MMRHDARLCLLLGAALLSACGEAPDRGGSNVAAIKVRGAEQERLHALGAFDLAIALKRAIYAAGYDCKQLTDGGFVAAYQNLDMWTAKCSGGREWAIFAGPDGSAQVRDCKDVAAAGAPACVIEKRPEGSFTQMPGAKPKPPKP